MKRKLSFFIATIMMLSMTPAMNVFAKTDNDLSKTVNAIGTDYDWGTNYATMRQAVVLTMVNAPTSGTYTNGTKIRVSLKNAEWSYNEQYNSTGSANTWFTTGAAIGLGAPFNSYDVGAKGTLAVGINQGIATNFFGTYPITTNQQYIVQFMSATDAEVTLLNSNSQSSATRVSIPLITKITGSGAATITVTDSTGSGVTQGTYTFANGVDGAVNVTVVDPKKTTAGDLALSEITLNETAPGKLEINTDTTKNNYIDLLAPTGYIWAKPTTGTVGDTTMAPKVIFYGGFSNNTHIGPASMSRVSGDNQTLRISLNSFNVNSAGVESGTLYGTAGLARSVVSSGIASIQGLKLVKDGDPSIGDINVRIQGSGVTTASYKVGEFAKKNVTMTVADKAIPEIVTGVYTQDPKYLGECLEVTIKETTKGAWNAGSEGGKLVLTPDSNWKFRAVEITAIDGIDTSKSALTGKGTASLASATVNNSTTPGVTLADDKLTFDRFYRKSDDSIKLSMKIWASVRPGYTGDITLKTHSDNEAFNSGSGVSAVIGKAIDPFIVTATPRSIEVGYMDVALSDISIKETKAGNFKRTDAHDSYMDSTGTIASSTHAWAGKDSYHTGGYRLWIANNSIVSFNSNGKIAATRVSGDVEIDECKVTTDYYNAGTTNFGRSTAGEINLKIKRESTVPSEIKISGISVDTMRSLPQGELDLRLGGSAVANFGVNSRGEGAFDTDYYTAVKGYVKLGGTASDPKKFSTEVAATVGSTKLVVEGKEVAMDVSPFNKNGNVLVPVWHILRAVGYEDQQVKWDANEKSVSIQEPVTGRTIKITIGSNTIIVNGVPIHFDGEPAQIKDSRTFLPFRAFGEIVLNTSVSWDQNTTTAWYNRHATGTTNTVPNAE